MSSDNVNVRITGTLKSHLKQQIGPAGLYDNASEYVRDLIRRDLQSRQQSWNWLKDQLAPALRADEPAFTVVTADDVIARNAKP